MYKFSPQTLEYGKIYKVPLFFKENFSERLKKISVQLNFTTITSTSFRHKHSSTPPNLKTPKPRATSPKNYPAPLQKNTISPRLPQNPGAISFNPSPGKESARAHIPPKKKRLGEKPSRTSSPPNKKPSGAGSPGAPPLHNIPAPARARISHFSRAAPVKIALTPYSLSGAPGVEWHLAAAAASGKSSYRRRGARPENVFFRRRLYAVDAGVGGEPRCS